MNIFGIGPELAMAGGIPLAIILRLQYVSKIAVRLPPPLRQIFKVIGIVLCVAGAFLWISSGLIVEKAFRSHKLVTSGPFRLTRHPLYAAFIVFVIPGTALICNNLLILIVSLDTFVVFKLRIGKEEDYLRREFGDEYLEYERKVAQLVPFIRI